MLYNLKSYVWRIKWKFKYRWYSKKETKPNGMEWNNGLSLLPVCNFFITLHCIVLCTEKRQPNGAWWRLYNLHLESIYSGRMMSVNESDAVWDSRSLELIDNRIHFPVDWAISLIASAGWPYNTSLMDGCIQVSQIFLVNVEYWLGHGGTLCPVAAWAGQ